MTIISPLSVSFHYFPSVWMYEDGELCAWECERDIIHLLRRNMVETSSMTVTDCSCPSSICLSIQVNVSDVHAGELYMLAGDPGQDSNIYSNSDHSVVMTKMASLPRVSKFFEFYSFSTNLLVYSFSDLRFLSRRLLNRWKCNIFFWILVGKSQLFQRHQPRL